MTVVAITPRAVDSLCQMYPGTVARTTPAAARCAPSKNRGTTP
jgi:hypothetical protein